ncbi:hypothetical protein JNUCC1_02720 [Lentibacillus sp. JNUCC-1]|uniref:VanZ family protein n=1 Tax=Lentibacillus sp. JNUCC-1 TaxID=2654513 RepID=UPI0012E7780D|nr:VanZ family protein [Lentibacillus sp. JNUCC-1]MUV38849.1 hypothetical protein [Lentibacillus sp. JNUCC-1]
MKKYIRVVVGISFISYIFALVILLFIGGRGYRFSDLSLLEYIMSSSNLVPFKTINAYVQVLINGSMNADIPLKNLLGNVLLFLPMGIYLPFYIKKMGRAGMFIVSMIVMLFLIEAVQIVTRRGSFDIDDFILNMAGALIGFGIWKMVMRKG